MDSATTFSTSGFFHESVSPKPVSILPTLRAVLNFFLFLLKLVVIFSAQGATPESLTPVANGKNLSFLTPLRSLELTHSYIFSYKFTLRCQQSNIVPIICHRCRWYRAVHLDEKIRNDPYVIFMGLGEENSWKKTRSKKPPDTVPLRQKKNVAISCLKHVGRDARAVWRGGSGLARAGPGGRSQPCHAQEGIGERGTAAAGRLHGGEGRGQLHTGKKV